MSKRSAQRHRAERREREGEKRLDTMEVKALDAVSEIVERKTGTNESRQPRFNQPTNILTSIFRWALSSMANEPGPRATVRKWDEWYRASVQQEPFLASIFNDVVQIDVNRGWSLTGGRNQVARYEKVINGFDRWIKIGNKYIEGNPNGGWRSYTAWQAQSYYATRMGFASEIGRVGTDGPLFTLWSVDPARCELTGSPIKPLRYYPTTGSAQEWEFNAYFRKCSLISTDETMLGYGFPAVARCYELARVMVGVLSHYRQKLGSKTPDGILTGANISETQWEEALRAREESLRADPESYLNSIATIMSSGTDIPTFALTTLSSLPDRWDIDLWTRIMMRGYESAFGYKGEFTYENAGVLGRGNEVEVQHRNATAMGGKDYILAHQGELQRVLPPTLEFLYDERDVQGDVQEAQLQLAKAQVITEISNWVEKQGGVETSRITTDQLLKLAADNEVVPDDWAPGEEDVTATDEEEAEDSNEIMSERIYRAMHSFPDEPIVRYSWPSDKTRIVRTERRRSFYLPKVITRSVESVAATYGEQLQAIADDDKASQEEKAKRQRELIIALAILAYLAGRKAGGVDEGEAMTADEKLVLSGWTTEQLSHVDDFAAAATEADNELAAAIESGDAAAIEAAQTKKSNIKARVDLWVAALAALSGMGLMAANADAMGIWKLGKTKEHCRTCAGLHGKRHRLSWYKVRGLIPREPGSTTLECRGYRCDCHIYGDKGDVLL